MIKATGQITDDAGTRPVVVLGFTADNLRKLQGGGGVWIEHSDLGLPPTALVIVYGEDEAALQETMAPIIGPDTVKHMDTPPDGSTWS